MLTRNQKSQCVDEISQKLSDSKAVFLVDFKGIDVEQMTELRKSLRKVSSEIKVVRNTLARQAMKSHAHVEQALSSDFVGPNAFIFSYEDPSASAKILKKYGEEEEVLTFKVGVMGETVLDLSQLKHLATLPGKQELRAQLLSLMHQPATSLVRLFTAASRDFLQVLNARRQSRAEAKEGED